MFQLIRANFTSFVFYDLAALEGLGLLTVEV